MKNRIKVLRAERDWSQQRLADEIGISRQAINAIERGKHDPSLQLTFDIADIFNLRVDNIFFPEKKLNPDNNEEN